MQGESVLARIWISDTNHTVRHYVAFIRKPLPDQDGLSWVMFNDEKVVKAEEVQRMKNTAYMYFFTRV